MAGDARHLAELHVRAWQWAYRGMLPDAYLDGLAEQTTQREAMWGQLIEPIDASPVWLAERDAHVLGFCHTARSRDAEPHTAELLSIYIEPDVAGTGVGAALMRHAVEDLRQQGYREAVLWVLDVNERARRFYEKGGWRVDGASKTEDVWGVVVREVRYRLDL